MLPEVERQHDRKARKLPQLMVADEELRQQSDELVETRRSVEYQRQRYADLFDFAPDGYLVTDPLGMIQEVNRAAAELLLLASGHAPTLVWAVDGSKPEDLGQFHRFSWRDPKAAPRLHAFRADAAKGETRFEGYFFEGGDDGLGGGQLYRAKGAFSESRLELETEHLGTGQFFYP